MRWSRQRPVDQPGPQAAAVRGDHHGGLFGQAPSGGSRCRGCFREVVVAAAAVPGEAPASPVETADASIGVWYRAPHPHHGADGDEPESYCEQADDETADRTSPLPKDLKGPSPVGRPAS